MAIRDNTEAIHLLRKIDHKRLREDLDVWLKTELKGREEGDVSTSQLEEIFVKVNPRVQSLYGVDIWDAMVLLNVAAQNESVNPPGFDDWRKLYESLSERIEREKVPATLQEDYDGSRTFHVWCPQEDFTRFTCGIEGEISTPAQTFTVVIVECRGNVPTGRQYTFDVGG